MIETLLTEPHNATDEEIRQLYGPVDEDELALIKGMIEVASFDSRMTNIYDLYTLRGNQEMAAKTLARIKDRVWARELVYRDAVSSPAK
jgi:hypothetical protein